MKKYLEWAVRSEQRKASSILRDLGLNDFLIEKVMFVLRRTTDAFEVASDLERFQIPEAVKRNIITVLSSQGFIQ